MIDATLKNANILIVDDQQANIDLLAEFLKMQGFTNVISTTDPLMTISLFPGRRSASGSSSTMPPAW